MDERREGEPKRVGEVAAERLRRLGKAAAVSTGFDELDRMTGGFQPSDLILVAGRPSMGKTALMLNIAERVTRDQEASQPVLYVSLETPAEWLVGRLLASVTGTRRPTLFGWPTARERESLEKGAAELRGRALLIDDHAPTVAEIRESALAACIAFCSSLNANSRCDGSWLTPAIMIGTGISSRYIGSYEIEALSTFGATSAAEPR